MADERRGVTVTTFNMQDLQKLLKETKREPLAAPPGVDVGETRLRRLHQVHVRRYLTMLEAAQNGASGYRVSELRELLVAWRNVEDSGFIFDKMSEQAKAEVTDAIFDEEN